MLFGMFKLLYCMYDAKARLMPYKLCYLLQNSYLLDHSIHSNVQDHFFIILFNILDNTHCISLCAYNIVYYNMEHQNTMQ